MVKPLRISERFQFFQHSRYLFFEQGEISRHRCPNFFEVNAEILMH